MGVFSLVHSTLKQSCLSCIKKHNLEKVSCINLKNIQKSTELNCEMKKTSLAQNLNAVSSGFDIFFRDCLILRKVNKVSHF